VGDAVGVHGSAGVGDARHPLAGGVAVVPEHWRHLAAIQEARKRGTAREQGMRAVAEEHGEEEELLGTEVTYRKQVATVERRH